MAYLSFAVSLAMSRASNSDCDCAPIPRRQTPSDPVSYLLQECAIAVVLHPPYPAYLPDAFAILSDPALLRASLAAFTTKSVFRECVDRLKEIVVSDIEGAWEIVRWEIQNGEETEDAVRAAVERIRFYGWNGRNPGRRRVEEEIGTEERERERGSAGIDKVKQGEREEEITTQTRNQSPELEPGEIASPEGPREPYLL
ncbi:hypothetical protein RUND412_002311 [Rhizina undulata]